MTEILEAHSDLFPCPSTGTLGSLSINRADIAPSHEEYYRGDDILSVNSAVNTVPISLFTLYSEEDLSLFSIENDDTNKLKPEIQFTPTHCLFCKHPSIALGENLEHMFERPGLSIPDKPYLIVDIETLVKYLRLVIFVYFECLHCRSQRNSAKAAQQHMMGTGHSKIDILSEDSEFKDFYDFHSTTNDSDGKTSELVCRPRLNQHRTIYKEARRDSSTSLSTALDKYRSQSNSALNQPALYGSKNIVKHQATFHNQLAILRAGE